MAINTYSPIGTVALVRRIADLLEEEGIETRYLSILGSWGSDGMPLVSIDEQAFRTLFFGCEVDMKREGCIITLSGQKYEIQWQATGYQAMPGPIVNRVRL